MDRLQFEAPQGTTVRLVRVDGDALIQGWDQDTVEIVLDGEADQCSVEQEGLTLSVVSHAALSVSLPSEAIVNVDDVNGDLVLRELAGPVSVSTVHGEALVQASRAPVSLDNVYGDLTVDGILGLLSVTDAQGDVRLNKVNAAVTLGAVHGDVRARAVKSTLEMGVVDGDVRVRGAGGLVSLEEGRSDLGGTELRGGLDARLVKGAITLRTAVMPGKVYRARAEGDIIARFPEETSARFTLQAEGAVHAHLPQVDEESENRLVGQAGSGEAQVELTAGGDLSVRIRGHGGRSRPDFDFDIDADISAQIEAQIAESLGAIDIDALAHREIEKAMHKAEREIEKARHRAEQQRHEAEQRMHRAQERAARTARRAQEKISRRAHLWTGSFGGRAQGFRAGRVQPKPQATEEEQLAILKMVQEGKISTEQAEMLLKALEGK